MQMHAWPRSDNGTRRCAEEDAELRARAGPEAWQPPIVHSVMEMAWRHRGQAELMTLEVVEKSTEEIQYLEQNKELVKIGGPKVLTSVASLHRQLGHPSRSKVVLAVKTRHLPNEFVQVARRYKCPTCLGRAQPKNVGVARFDKSPHFHHSVAIDTFYIEWDGKKRAVFTIMDELSRYEVNMEIKEEIAEMEIALFEPTSAKTFWFPAILRLDASGPHQGEKFAGPDPSSDPSWRSPLTGHPGVQSCCAPSHAGDLQERHARDQF